MDIASMILREDFYGILNKTIEVYFKKVRNQNISVSYTQTEGMERFRIYTLGGIVSRERKPKGAKHFLLAEFNIRNSIIKYLGGKAIVYFLLWTRKCGSVKSLYIEKDVLGSNEIISPQNRSIRFYNYDNMTVDCIIKEGFTYRFFNNQNEFRKKYHYDFMVPLLDSGEGWFREGILIGHPLARVTDNHQYQTAINDATKNIAILANDTLAYISADVYIENLLKKAKELTDSAKAIKEIKSYEKGLSILQYVEMHTCNICMDIPTCISHGDFQTGNIWVTKKGKTLIYDWETTSRRSVWYDSSTIMYSLRRPYGWEQFINNEMPVSVLNCDPDKNRSKSDYDFIKTVVLLEDYLFLLEDMMELPEKWGNDIFDENIERISRLLI